MDVSFLSLGQLGANTYFVKSNSDIFIVDPGASAQKIISAIDNLNLRYIFLTHAHVDHIGAIDDLKKQYDAPVVIHKSDAQALNNGSLNLCNLFGENSPVTKADIIVNDGDTLPFSGKELRIIHTPGHTAGSMCIYTDGLLFSGDTIFLSSIGRTDFPGGSFEDLQCSIQDKIYTLPLSTIIYPGHGSSTTVDYEKSFNPFVRG